MKLKEFLDELNIIYGIDTGLPYVHTNTDFFRGYYVPISRKGIKEIVLVTRNGGVPGPDDEPGLYGRGRFNASESKPNEVHLYFDRYFKIILTTDKEDRDIRRDVPAIDNNILFESIDNR